MTLRESIFAAMISGSPAVRVYPNILPPNPLLPASIFTMVSRVDEETIDGADAGLTNAHIQIDVYAKTQIEADVVADIIRMRMLAASDFASWSAGGFDAFEEDTLLYRVMREFSVWKN